MTFDRNNRFGVDASYESSARRVADLLWETTKGDLSSVPQSYLETFRHDFSDGNLSMLEFIDRVNLGSDATYEDYCEAVDKLMSVPPSSWPKNLDNEDIYAVYPSELKYNIEPDYDFSEFDFADELIAEEEVVTEGQPAADPLSSKMELFFKKVISSVYLDGVGSVTDVNGNPPNAANNYLMAPDGKSFTGKFYDQAAAEGKEFPFQIMENQSGAWTIKY
jgi:hypothetical protein